MIDSNHLNALLAFAEAHPFPAARDVDDIRRYATTLISSPAMVIERRENGTLLAAAILVDRIDNPGNNACLEMIGLSNHAEWLAELRRVVEEARRRLPAEKSGFELTLPADFPAPPEWLAACGLAPAYRLYDMRAPLPAPALPVRDPAITEPAPDDLPVLYAVMREAFRDNPDTSIPPYDEWLARRQQPHSRLLIHRGPDGIDGYINVLHRGDSGHINTIGVLPVSRRRGLGYGLLAAALADLDGAGAKTCSLTAAAENAAALGLYRSFDFEIEKESRVFIWGRPGQASS